MERTNRLASAVDIGGTKIVAAVVAPDGQVLARHYCLTLAGKGRKTVIDRLLSALNAAMAKASLEDSKLAGIGIAAAGIIDTTRGIITTSPNLPGWSNVPLKNTIAERLGLVTYLINDASAAALGEHRFGAGKGVKNLVYLTVSTGIGGGIIVDGKLYFGADGCAGEIGHMIIETHGPQCHCGKFGCLEALASGWAVVREAVRRINQGEKSTLLELVNGKLESITAETVALAARRNDLLACDVVAKAANYLGIGLANLVNIFNPEMIVIGGGLSNMGSMLLAPARRAVKETAFQLPASRVRIVRGHLGGNAGIIGAAAYVFDQQPQGGIKL